MYVNSNKSRRIVIVGVMMLAFSFLLSPDNNITLHQRVVLAQPQQTSSGNISAQVTPQGTSLHTRDKAVNNTNLTGTTLGPITAQVAPQGTSLSPTNASSANTSSPAASSAGNVTASVTPQGTSLQNTNHSSDGR
jgi:hypothetical protein